jgi:hypothetical protein
MKLGNRKLERLIGEERMLFSLWQYPLQGPSLRFVSGPGGMAETVKPGWWLNVWESMDFPPVGSVEAQKAASAFHFYSRDTDLVTSEFPFKVRVCDRHADEEDEATLKQHLSLYPANQIWKLTVTGFRKTSEEHPGHILKDYILARTIPDYGGKRMYWNRISINP